LNGVRLLIYICQIYKRLIYVLDRCKPKENFKLNRVFQRTQPFSKGARFNYSLCLKSRLVEHNHGTHRITNNNYKMHIKFYLYGRRSGFTTHKTHKVGYRLHSSSFKISLTRYFKVLKKSLWSSKPNSSLVNLGRMCESPCPLKTNDSFSPITLAGLTTYKRDYNRAPSKYPTEGGKNSNSHDSNF